MVTQLRSQLGEDTSSPDGAGKDSSVLEAMWDDEDTRAFYECLPDLRAFVCAVLLGEAEPNANEQSLKAQDLPSESAPESEQGQIASPDSAEVSADSGTFLEGKNEKDKDTDEKDKEKTNDPDKEKEKMKGLEGINLDGLLQRLPGCVSRDLIDQLTVEFCYLNSKLNQKKLVRALFNVPSTSLELLPDYSCMVATVSTCMKDVSSMLLQLLDDEFQLCDKQKGSQ